LAGITLKFALALLITATSCAATDHGDVLGEEPSALHAPSARRLRLIMALISDVPSPDAFERAPRCEAFEREVVHDPP
jgi:hypothetical protein